MDRPAGAADPFVPLDRPGSPTNRSYWRTAKGQSQALALVPGLAALVAHILGSLNVGGLHDRRNRKMMTSGPFTYLRLIIKTACRHSLHAAHSVILALIIVAGVITSLVPQVEVLVDLHGWQVLGVVLGGILAVRLLLAPYWIWKGDQQRMTDLSLQVANRVQNEQKLAIKAAALDDIAQEIAWAVNNLVNPKPHPASTADPESAIAAFEKRLLAWYDQVSNKLENREVFTQGDQTHFDVLGFITPIQMWGHPKLDNLFSQLRLKIERLREIEHRARERN